MESVKTIRGGGITLFRVTQLLFLASVIFVTAGCSGDGERSVSDDTKQPKISVEAVRYSPFQLSGLLGQAGIPCEKEGPLFEASVQSGANVSRATCTHSNLGEGVYSMVVTDDSSYLSNLIRLDICSQYLDSRPQKTFVIGENWYIIDYVQSVFLPEDFQVATKGHLVKVGDVCI